MKLAFVHLDRTIDAAVIAIEALRSRVCGDGRRWVGLIVLVMGGVSCGYGWRAMHEDAATMRRTQNTVELDYFFSIQSFSEIENAKAQLRATADQFLSELRVKRGMAWQSLDVNEALQDFERGVTEFRGTGQELAVVHEQLWLLNKAERYDQWLYVYLQTLYQHPTHDMVGRLADRAVLIGKATRRENEVRNALCHVARIPLNFSAKQQVEQALTRMAGTPQVTAAGL